MIVSHGDPASCCVRASQISNVVVLLISMPAPPEVLAIEVPQRNPLDGSTCYCTTLL
jgi:hypothetical protein